MAGGNLYTEPENALILRARSYADYRSLIHDLGLEPRTPQAFKRQRNLLKQFLADEPPTPDPPQIPPRIERPAPSGDDEWEELFSYLESAAERRGGLSESTNSIEWTAPVDGPIAVAFVSDIHAGSEGVLYRRFREDMEAIASTEGLYAICNGDLMENAKIMSKAGNAVYSSIFTSPREQLEYVRRRMGIAKGKWVLINAGNHDSRDYNVAGIDRLPDLCRELEVPYGTEAGATISLRVGSQDYVVIAKHDYRGKSQINKTNSQRRLWDEWPHSWENADVVALAHLHEPDLQHTTRKGSGIVYLRSGSYKIRDGYAAKEGYRPDYGVPVVLFDHQRHEMTPYRDFLTGVQAIKDARQRWAHTQRPS